MNIYIKIFLWSIVMILGFSALLMSVMVFSIGRADGVVFAWVTLCIGIVFGPLSLFKIVSLNNQFKREALEELLKHPEKILLRFTNEKGKEVIISEDELFVGYHITHSAFFMNLWKICG
jgi:membrane-bound ClpP family serine protease